MYRYYSILRPVAPGTFPKKALVTDIVNFDNRKFCPEINREAWGYIEYESPLSKEDMNDYDLVQEICSETA